jgi:leucyl aminopeptidase (aminopeptidase T)
VTDLSKPIRTVLVDCLGVTKEETVLVLTDPSRKPIAEALVDGARALGAETIFVEMSERASHGSEPPEPVAAAMLGVDVVIAPTTKSVSHTEARRAATEAGARAATMPTVTEDMLLRTMSVDYGEIRRRSQMVAEKLTQGSRVRVTSEQGTDITFDITGRSGIADTGDLRSPGSFGNLPAGEGFVAPVEGKTTGRVVFDGSIWPVGILSEPLVVTVDAGYATEFSGPAAEAFRETISPYGREAFAVAELGIGTNDAARVTGEVLEDEKILGTVHVAFGDNHSFGGTVRVASHQDGVVLHPRVEIDGEVVLEEGKLLL